MALNLVSDVAGVGYFSGYHHLNLPSPTYAGQFRTIQTRESMGYYNSGFLSGLGGVLKSVGPYIAAAGSIAAEVLPAIYHTGTSGAQQSPAGGPTSAPVVAKPSGGMRGTALVAPTTALGRAEQAIMHPIQTTEQLLGMGGGSRPGRYGSPGEKGYHMIKRGPHAGMWVRNRHRNPCNIRALRRSLSRIHGFEKVARKVIHFTHPRKAVGHAVFKRRRRRS